MRISHEAIYQALHPGTGRPQAAREPAGRFACPGHDASAARSSSPMRLISAPQRPRTGPCPDTGRAPDHRTGPVSLGTLVERSTRFTAVAPAPHGRPRPTPRVHNARPWPGTAPKPCVPAGITTRQLRARCRTRGDGPARQAANRCRPRHYFWAPTAPGARHQENTNGLLANTSPNERHSRDRRGHSTAGKDRLEDPSRSRASTLRDSVATTGNPPNLRRVRGGLRQAQDHPDGRSTGSTSADRDPGTRCYRVFVGVGVSVVSVGGGGEPARD